ncbi:hypothetical protein XAPC_4124 [Xanthomonas citri pv. punicae str. LMG 859]|nr:hypothetical protein XAPC_4124 [Xanthomonas citri pv. punicae str. LMG 859]
MPMRSAPRSPWANCPSRSSARSSCGSTRFATASRYWPAWVRRRLRPSRNQMSVPSCCSSFFMLWLSADWVRFNTPAAAVSEPCCSTCWTMVRWMRSSIQMIRIHGLLK